MNTLKPGDIAKQQVAGGRWEFFHIEAVHSCGAVDAIDDSTGKACGLSLHRSRLLQATMAELAAHRAQMAGA